MSEETTQAGDDSAAPAEAAEEVVQDETVAEAPAEEETETEEKPERTFTQKQLEAKLAKQAAIKDRRYARELAALNERLDALSKVREAPVSEEILVEPKRDDYGPYEDYLAARADWRTDLRNQQRDERLRAEREQERNERLNNEQRAVLAKMADTRVADGRKEYPDFDQVMQDAFSEEVLTQDTELYYGIIESKLGHRIAYYLAHNPDEAERLNRLSPREVNKELGRLEDKLAKGSAKTKSGTMDTLQGSGRVVKINDPMRNDISMDDYVRLRNAQERKAKGL